jgi:hypothetical protein
MVVFWGWKIFLGFWIYFFGIPILGILGWWRVSGWQDGLIAQQDGTRRNRPHIRKPPHRAE